MLQYDDIRTAVHTLAEGVATAVTYAVGLLVLYGFATALASGIALQNAVGLVLAVLLFLFLFGLSA